MNTNPKTLKENLQDGAETAVKSATHAASVATETVRNLASDVSAQAADTVAAVRDGASVATDSVRNLASDVSAKAVDTAAAMRDGAVDRLDEARDALSDSGDRFAETLRRAAEEPAAGSVQARVLSAVAGGVSTAASTLRDRSVSEMATDLRALARRNPGAFAAGAAVAGFALARFLRSTSRARSSDDRP